MSLIMNLREIGEFGLIQRLQTQLATRAGVRLSIGDDAAILEPLQCPIITMDALVEGVHFRRDWTSARALGRKSMAVNLSDLAASGARPVAAFVSLSLGSQVEVEWIEELYAGFEDAARQFNFSVAGGDTTKSRGDSMLSVALVGEAMNLARGPVLRSGAQVGDALLVSGTLGDSAAGLALLQEPGCAVSQATRDFLLQRHHEPTPRLAVMQALLEWDANAIHAALDLSDGLVGDAAHLAKRSNLSLQIEVDQLPLSPHCQEAAPHFSVAAWQWALSGGEDYELLLAVAPEKVEEMVKRIKEECGVTLTHIGYCHPAEERPRVVVRQNGVEKNVSAAWTHF